MNQWFHMSNTVNHMNNTAQDDASNPRSTTQDTTLAAELLMVSTFRTAENHESHLEAPYWALEVFVKGGLHIQPARRGDVQGQEVWHRCESGHAVMYAPGTKYTERLSSGTCQSIFAYFNLSEALARRLGVTADGYLWIEDPQMLLVGFLTRMLEDHETGWAGILRATGGLYQVLGVMGAGEVQGDVLHMQDAAGTEKDLLWRVHRFLRSHLADGIRLADVAGHLGVSESGLSHAYRKLAGRGPMETLRLFRLDAVMQDLRRRNDKLDVLARRYGFADAFHLSRSFKQQYGHSPRQWMSKQGN